MITSAATSFALSGADLVLQAFDRLQIRQPRSPATT